MQFRIIILLSLLFPLYLSGQRSCGTMDHLNSAILNNPDLKERMENIEKHTQQTLKTSAPRNAVTLIIPVVVHVVYNSSSENISDAQIYSQIDVLNEDFRRLNSDADNYWSQAADVEIEFCLAKTDPEGRSTCGITRTYTTTTKFPKSGNPMKFDSTGGKSAWTASDYLNIWVCDIDGLLGYAQFPGAGPASTDGVVIDYRSFGRSGDLRPEFNLGRTGTHEVGHWLNLRHIWGDGDCSYDDYVSDTPISDDHNYNCDIGHISCGTLDMVQNYMDYSDDVCMNLFTQGQKDRMRALFEPGGFRESLLFSNGCSTDLPCSPIILTLNFDDYPEDISWDFRDANDQIIFSGAGYSSSLYGQSVTETFCAQDGYFQFNIYDSYGDGLCCNEGSGSYTLSNESGVFFSSNGNFSSTESHDFEHWEQAHRFIGPGTDWNDANNWNTSSTPGECFRGVIMIESDCDTNGVNPLNGVNHFFIKSGKKLTVN